MEKGTVVEKGRSGSVLATERRYFQGHRRTLRRRHPGKFLLIKNKTVHGAFDTEEEAVVAGVKKFPGPSASFLVRSVDQVEDPVLYSPSLALAPEARL